MSKFWPDDGGAFDEVFSAGDPCPGEVIRDKYGLIEYAADVSIATTHGPDALELLKLRDPEEHQRVQRLARRRAEALRRVYNVPADSRDWIIVDM